MSKYVVRSGEFISPVETTGSIQCGEGCSIEISSVNSPNTGIKIGSREMVAFDGTVYVRSIGQEGATFNTVPFKITGKGGGGGGSTPYTLPTASATIKGGIKVGSGLEINNETLSVIKKVELSNWTSSKLYNKSELIVNNNKLYISTATHTSSSSFIDDIDYWKCVYSDTEPWSANTQYIVGNEVIKDGKIYACSVTHVSTSTFDDEKWILISDTIKLADEKDVTDLLL